MDRWRRRQMFLQMAHTSLAARTGNCPRYGVSKADTRISIPSIRTPNDDDDAMDWREVTKVQSPVLTSQCVVSCGEANDKVDAPGTTTGCHNKVTPTNPTDIHQSPVLPHGEGILPKPLMSNFDQARHCGPLLSADTHPQNHAPRFPRRRMVRKLDIPLRKAFGSRKEAEQLRVRKVMTAGKPPESTSAKITDSHSRQSVARPPAEGQPALQVRDNMLQSPWTAIPTSVPAGLNAEVLVALTEIRNSVTAIAKDLESHKSEVGCSPSTVPTAVPSASTTSANPRVGSFQSPTDLILIEALNLVRESINLQKVKPPSNSKSKRNEQSQLLGTLVEIGQSLRALKEQALERVTAVPAEEPAVICKPSKQTTKTESECSSKKQTRDQAKQAGGPKGGCLRSDHEEDTIRQSVRLAEDSDSDQNTLCTESVEIFGGTPVQAEEAVVTKLSADARDDRPSRPTKQAPFDVICCLTGNAPAAASSSYGFQRPSGYVWQPNVLAPAVAGYSMMMMMPMMVGAWVAPAAATPVVSRPPEVHYGPYCSAEPRSRIFPPMDRKPEPQQTSSVGDALPQTYLAAQCARLSYSAVQQMRTEAISQSEKFPTSKDSSCPKASTQTRSSGRADAKAMEAVGKQDKQDSFGSSDASLKHGQASHCALKLSCFC
ncbi:unnamed protein product [Schistocephalus solidus]|uniref:JmjC domain-containing protein n=1 Tax=Schistocephalus solidus TaxID=70667 RepID=A0A183T2F2_SCHSO|nr:unnamed protein product [Schistocephalus solidus]